MNTPAHDRATTTLFLATAGVAVVTQSVEIGLIAAGVGLGFLISPDWDWVGYQVFHRGLGKTYMVSLRPPHSDEEVLEVVYGRVLRRWPDVIQWIFYPYARLFKHRGISHHWLWGTLSRLVYLVFPIPLAIYFPVVLWVYLGLWFADLIHLLLDRV